MEHMGEKRLEVIIKRLEDELKDCKSTIQRQQEKILEYELRNEMCHGDIHLIPWLENIIESFAYPFYVINAKNRQVIIANSAAKKDINNMRETKCWHHLAHNIGKPCSELHQTCPLEVVTKTGKPFKTEHIHCKENGEKTYIEVYAYPLLDSDHNVDKVIEYCFDITERKKAEVALEHSEIKYRSIFENSQLGISISTLDGWFIDANEAKLKMYGYTLEEMKDINLFNVYEDPCDRQRIIDILLKRGSVKDFEVRAKNKQQQIVYLSHNMNLIRLNGQNVILSITVNLTDKKKAELLLIESEKKYRELVENAMSAILKMDMEGNIQFFNEYAEKILGYTKEEIIGKNMMDTILQLDYEMNDMTSILNGYQKEGGINSSKFNFVQSYAKTKDKLWISWNIKPIYDETDKLVGLIAIGYDITDIKKMEDKFKQAKEEAEAANIAKSEFLANMSHEIRTPLNGVIGFTDILLKRETNTEKLEMLQLIYNSGKTLLEMINQILDLSKIEAGKIELENKPFNLNKAFIQCIKMFEVSAYTKGLRLDYQIDSSLLVDVMGDEVRFKQILVNLINNAIKFTGKGSVGVYARKVNEEGNHITASFSVSDTGIGIPENKVDKVFERFYQGDLSITKKYGGTGLGLSIVKEILDLMDGHIEVISKEGAGSKFVFEISFKKIEDSVTIGDKISVKDKNYPMVLDILVAEDNEISQKLIKRLMEGKGYSVDIAENGMEVLNKIEERKYDLILMDIQMPIMDGLETTRRIRKKGNKIKIIALTASAMDGDHEKCFSAGMDDYIAKPINRDELFEKLEKVFNG